MAAMFGRFLTTHKPFDEPIMEATHGNPSENSRTDRRERYERVLRTIEYNTGFGVPPHTIRLTLCAHGGDDPEEIDKSIRALVENDDVVVWHDENGQRQLCPADEDALRTLAEHLAQELRDTQQLARVNQAIAEVSENE